MKIVTNMSRGMSSLLLSKYACHRALLLKNVERCCSTQSFRFEDLKINLAMSHQLMRKPEASTLAFGATFSDHMFQVEWTHFGGWGIPQIVPLHNFQMHPGSKVFHYGQAIFEGMKAFRHANGKVTLFRPELNIQRLLSSSERSSLPTFDRDELLKCLKKLVSIDKQWVPDLDMSSLYIRPTFIGVEGTLGVSAAKTALLYIITCPVGPYFGKDITKPVSLLADPKFVRAWPGGVGHFKMASNYAPTLYVQKLAQEQGLDQVLWLSGADLQIAEGGAMNIFILLKTKSGGVELVTPPLDGTILPGITRKSVLELTRKWNEFTVSERTLTMNELLEAKINKRLLEIFLCGTACCVCPVKLIRFQGDDIEIPTMESGMKLYLRVLKTLTDIQYGRIKSEWSVDIE
ncbi:hypothetical protein JTE90_020192 [Oedothorax gibbosus]|uniref:Branched-chain-amino-acid aminotransferase n=1 Tax=Oedothorax gibbosus TaxID=931172 RepID=A0AAV6U0F8_9ARAC|nr:hypothetical protein JTE90_020192 [Oedothorax gibbosus]